MLRFCHICIVVFCLLGVVRSAFSTDFHVTSATDLQSALVAAGENSQDDRVFLAGGTYTGGFAYATTTANDLLMAPESGLTAKEVVLDGLDQQRVMTAELVDGASLMISNLTFANGRVVQDSPYAYDEGAGLFVKDGMIITLSDCVIRDCFSYSSGAGVSTMWNPSEVRVAGCTVISNRTDYAGAGAAMSLNATNLILLETNIVAYNSSGYAAGGLKLSVGSTGRGRIQLTGNRIAFNHQRNGCDSGGGAAVISSVSNLVVEGNVIEGNRAGSRGGGLKIGSCKTALIAENTIRNNRAVYDGGGLHSTTPEIEIRDNRFEGNSVNYGSCSGVDRYAHGGAISLQYVSDAYIYNNVIVDNVASGSWYGGEGGGIYSEYDNSAEIRIINNTIANNQGYGNGGGVYMELDSDTDALGLYNNIIWGNSSTGMGTDVFVTGNPTAKDAYYNNWHGIDALWTHSVSNRDVAPQYMAADTGDYQLQGSSACIDAGYNSTPGLPLTDIDGYNRVDNGRVDMGAYEQSSTACHPADANTDWSLSEAEYSSYAAAWKDGDDWSTGPSPVPMTYATRAGYLLKSGGTYHNQGGGRPLCWQTGTGN